MPKMTRNQKLELARRLHAAALSMNGYGVPAARAFSRAYQDAHAAEGTWWAWIAELAHELERLERRPPARKTAA